MQLFKNPEFPQNGVLFHIFLESWGHLCVSLTFSSVIEKGLLLAGNQHSMCAHKVAATWSQDGRDNMEWGRVSGGRVHV